jgi:allophanate hydrolase
MSIETGFQAVRAALAQERVSPEGRVDAALQRIAAWPDPHVWLHLAPRSALMARAAALRAGPDKPLHGLLFGVKDNIDVAGMPTTAACPDYAYAPRVSSPPVQQLEAAGALCLGKLNMDQFANGLVGRRGPTPCRNAFSADHIPGGSSSGSGVAVAAHMVDFALGTDTGGSGRVPAALNNVVGLKQSVGLVSNRGSVAVNRTLDCINPYALSCGDALEVLQTIRGYDPQSYFSRPEAGALDLVHAPIQRFRFAVPRASQLEFFGDALAEAQYHLALARLQVMGGERVEIDFSPYLEAGRLLFFGPWIAERFLVVRDFFRRSPGSFHPVTRQIFETADRFSATEAFEAWHALDALKRQVRALQQGFDVLALPTVGTVFRVDAVAAEPVQLNTHNGRYTYFVNLLDLCAVAVPAGLRPDGLPFGLQLVAPALHDAIVVQLAAQFQAAHGQPAGLVF